jgi:hypothetical protein
VAGAAGSTVSTLAESAAVSRSHLAIFGGLVTLAVGKMVVEPSKTIKNHQRCGFHQEKW